MLAEPLKLTPPIFLAVARIVAVAANLDPPWVFFEQGKADEDQIRTRSGNI